MGRRGPRPEPAAIKVKKGSSRRPIGTDPVAPDEKAVRVVAPEWISADGRKVWDRIAPRLAEMNLLSQIDAETFGRYCNSFARWLRMQMVLDAEGETYESESPHGKYKRAHPAFLIADRLGRELLAIEANFGLNPAERQRIYAARAAAAAGGGMSPDLFGQREKTDGKGSRTTAPPAKPAKPKSAVGFLN